MEGIIPSAEISPRIEQGIIFWYYRDTFQLELVIKLRDEETLEPIKILPSEEIIVSFYQDEKCGLKGKQNQTPIFSQVFNNIENNKIIIKINDEITNRFTPGKYCYCIKYNYPNNRRTIVADAKIEVEPCKN